MPPPSDSQRLARIIEAIDWIAEFIDAMEFEDFRIDHKTQLSVERALEIIGEAANHLSSELIARYPQVPWRQIVDLRNVVSHEYFQVRLENIWQVAIEDVPALRDQIARIIKELD
jgi:uncharacterized protein with HEPN domain